MFGLIGYPLGHSFSQNYFTEKFESLGLPYSYTPFPLKEISQLPELISENPEIKGLNVTFPHKEKVLNYLDALSEDAKAIGAVNVIKFIKRNGKTFSIGYNSDWKGFLLSLKSILPTRCKKALILGTGGASKAVAYALEKLGIEYLFVSRSIGKGKISYQQIDTEIIDTCQLIINATPLGMSPYTDEFPDLPYHLINSNHICYDLIYNPEKTVFLRKCQENGAKIYNGMSMLHNQAELSWQIWNES